MKIGLEIHVQLPTKSKMFCSCPTTDAPAPNTHVCPVCLGMPGSRPVLNKQVLVYGIMLAKMLGCKITDTTWFSRKTYFYPDMSKSVQITQYDHPIGEGGVVYLNGKKPIRITRIHLEEDPGKTKRTSDMSSLVDYNRSGIPLAEIVTEPDLATPEEAREFLAQLIADIKHTIDLPENGERSIRCDCNISVGKERCEVKNVTGLKNAETALRYEMIRQIKVLKAGGKIERETRRRDQRHHLRCQEEGVRGGLRIHRRARPRNIPYRGACQIHHDQGIPRQDDPETVGPIRDRREEGEAAGLHIRGSGTVLREGRGGIRYA